MSEIRTDYRTRPRWGAGAGGCSSYRSFCQTGCGRGAGWNTSRPPNHRAGIVSGIRIGRCCGDSTINAYLSNDAICCCNGVGIAGLNDSGCICVRYVEGIDRRGVTGESKRCTLAVRLSDNSYFDEKLVVSWLGLMASVPALAPVVVI